MSVVIFTDEPVTEGGWHGNVLADAFEKQGIKTRFISLQDCILDLSQSKPEIHLANLRELPKAAFVRGIAGGTFQQITSRLNVLHVLKSQGMLVYNNARAIERTVDKAMTSFLLQDAGIRIPKTWVCESRQAAHAIIHANRQSVGSQLVIKPLFGSQGQGVRLIDQALPLPGDQYVEGVFYMQQLIAAKNDYRVFIVNNQVVSAMRRTGSSWLHNVSKGAICEFCDEEDIYNLALQAALVLNINYCGVDLIRGADGQLMVLEINSIPAWRGLQSVTSTDIALALTHDVLRLLS